MCDYVEVCVFHLCRCWKVAEVEVSVPLRAVETLQGFGRETARYTQRFFLKKKSLSLGLECKAGASARSVLPPQAAIYYIQLRTQNIS